MSTTSIMSTTAGPPLEIILPAVIGGVVLIAAVAIGIYCFCKIKKKRAFEGKYSPSGNEEKGGVRMNDMMNVIQPPPPERLI